MQAIPWYVWKLLENNFLLNKPGIYLLRDSNIKLEKLLQKH